MHLCPKKNFVKLVFEDFLSDRKSRGKLVFVFDLGGGVSTSKPLGFERGIHMCGGHVLEFLDCHICDEEGGKMIVNLQHRRVLCKKINIIYEKNYKKMKGT